METISSNPYYDEMMRRSGRGLKDETIGPLYQSIHFQRGYGVGFMDPFPYETYGLGFGDTLSSLFRMAMPYLKQGLKYLGKKAVDTAANVASDAIEGRSVSASAKENVSSAAGDVFAKIPKTLAAIADKSRTLGKKSVNSSRALSESTSDSPPPPAKRRKFSSARKRSRFQSKIGRGILKTYPGLSELV